MATKPNGYSLLQDFILGDRRLFERRDIKTELIWSDRNSVEHSGNGPGSATLFSSEDVLVGFTLTNGERQGRLRIQTPVDLRSEEKERLRLLAGLVAYLDTAAKLREGSELARNIGRVLKSVREMVGLSQSSVAEQIEKSRITFSRWEGGGQCPTNADLYRWCKALGLVCSPKTALVHVVDFSPELLRFLQEDPTRLQSLTPDQFERFVAERLDRMGYNVTLTGSTNQKDGGIDLIAVPKLANVGSVVIAGQMKHHRDRKTEREAVDRLLAWKDSYFGVGMLVTNTSFTRDAIWTAQQERNRHFLRLRDFIDLKRWLQDQYGSEQDWREIPDRIELAPGVVIEIPKPRIVLPINFKS